MVLTFHNLSKLSTRQITCNEFIPADGLHIPPIRPRSMSRRLDSSSIIDRRLCEGKHLNDMTIL